MRQFAALTLVFVPVDRSRVGTKNKTYGVPQPAYNGHSSGSLHSLRAYPSYPTRRSNGNASFFFSESEFEDALEWFLSSYKLFRNQDGNRLPCIPHPSFVRCGTGLANLEADDVDLALLVRAFSRLWE